MREVADGCKAREHLKPKTIPTRSPQGKHQRAIATFGD